MSQPVPPQPSAEPDATPPVETGTGDDTSTTLNRAERRAKARQAEPSHVGPREDLQRQARGARAHSKRRR